MPKTRPPYPPEFRAEAVRLLRESGKTVTEIGRNLGVSLESVRNWVRQQEFLVAFAISPLGTAVQSVFCATVVALSLVYLWCQQRNLREGVDVAAIYAEIPPE